MSDVRHIDWDLRTRPTLAAVAGRLSPSWRGYFRIAADGGRNVSTNATSSAEWGGVLPGTLYERPGTDPSAAALRTPAEATAALDRHGVDEAVLNPTVAPRVSGLASARWSAELARAINDWTVEEWLPADERLRASILVSTRDPRLAAQEIERLGAHERTAQVVLGYPQALLGDRSLDPLYGAAAEHGLPVLLQAGGAYTGANKGLSRIGHPLSAYEAERAWIHAAQPHLTSLVAQGVFARHPGLRLVLSGFGIAWLPSLLWELDAAYDAGDAVPPARVERRPSETLREHVRFTTAGLERPADPGRLVDLLRLVDGADLLLFGSGARGPDDPEAAALLAALAPVA
ncbi:MAG TPA: amidohydrolase family protein [Baekduia sp.]